MNTSPYRLLLILTVLTYSPPVFALDSTFSGHTKYQLTHSEYDSEELLAMLGPDTATDHSLDIRANAEFYQDKFEFVTNAELLTVGGDSFEAREALRRALSLAGATLPDDRTRLFDLTADFLEEDKFATVARFDRAYLGYADKHFVIRAGRQAVTLGNGLVFQALDLFNPFSPTEIDKDYKSGDDLFYAQYLFDSGDDLEFIAVPRRDRESHAIEDDRSSFALKWHGQLLEAETDYEIVAAAHYNQPLFGFGLSKSLFDAVFRIDYQLTRDQAHKALNSVVANVDRSWEIFGYNVYAYLEFFYSQVGDASGDYDVISPELLDRIIRGELFTLAERYISTGGRIELTPRTNLFINQIINLDDTSGFLQIRSIFDWAEDSDVQLGVNIPLGPSGTEFGGINQPGGTVGPALSAYLRTSYYF